MSFNPALSGIGGATDVAVSAKQDNHVLTYDSTVDKWRNEAVAAANVAGLPALITTASTEDRDRANHTGTQSLDTITETTAKKILTAAERTKLASLSADGGGSSAPALDERGAWLPLTNLHVDLVADPAFRTPAVRLDRFDMVRFDDCMLSVATGATIAASTTTTNDIGEILFNIPAACRPARRVLIDISATSGGTRFLFIQPNGNVTMGLADLGASAKFTLSGKTYWV